MTPSAKNRSLISIIVFLLITNIILIVFFLVLDRPGPRNQRGRNQNGLATMLQRDVHFSPGQINEYLDLRKQQLDSIHGFFDDLRKSKMEFYNQLYATRTSDSAIEQMAGVIAQRQKNLDLYMFHHFKMLRDICTPDQLPLFDSTLGRVIVRMTGRAGRGPRGPGRK